jgi:hypothetical protein
MKFLKTFLIFSLAASFFILGGCQAASSPKESAVKKEAPVPYSKGPTSSPETMKGPSGPPPSQVQTEKENVQITLPPAN